MNYIRTYSSITHDEFNTTQYFFYCNNSTSCYAIECRVLLLVIKLRVFANFRFIYVMLSLCMIYTPIKLSYRSVNTLRHPHNQHSLLLVRLKSFSKFNPDNCTSNTNMHATVNSQVFGLMVHIKAAQA